MSITPSKINVLLVLEESYPFSGGGIFTWAYQFIDKISNVSFVIYSINSNLETEYKYELCDNLRNNKNQLLSFYHGNKMTDVAERINIFKSRGREVNLIYKKESLMVYEIVNQPKSSKIDDLLF